MAAPADIVALVAANLARVRAQIAAVCAACGRDPASVRLLAVSKTAPPAALAPLCAAGQCDFGENRHEHLALMHAGAPPAARFHFIGRIQGKQIGKWCRMVVAVHSLDDADHARKLDRLCADAGRRMQVFVQVNTSGEPQKGGLPPADLGPMLDVVRALPQLDLLGVMCMAPDLHAGASPDQVRACFAGARMLAAQHGVGRLSMGMSSDLDLAIAEGSTDVRVGSALFAGLGAEQVA